MENSTPTRRRTTLDLPKTTDTGLTEWATKIKMMQQEVDEDAEDEQRKLQEEIEKSRLERARRRNSTSIDWTKSSSSPISVPSNITSNRTINSGGVRVHKVDIVDKITETKSDNTKEPISLAAFMGSKAAGPRLNKPAPQTNSYNAELYDITKHDSPHPIFGKPLIRPPSQTQLTEKPATPPQPQTEVVSSSISENSLVPNQKLVKPSQAKSLAEAMGGQGSSPRLTKPPPTKGYSEATSTPGVSVSHSVSQGRILPGMSSYQLPRPNIPSSVSEPAESSRPSQPAFPTRRISSPVVVPSLSRPIQFQATPSSPLPIITASSTPAPAFLRAIPSTEELHPSLTKLQGRGIVGQRVRAATALKEASSAAEEQSSASPLRKRPSVLDKWQSAVSSSQMSATPILEKTKTSEYTKPTPAYATRRELPGMNLGTSSPHKSHDERTQEIREEVRTPPIRLPGMLPENAQPTAYLPLQVTTISSPILSEPAPLQKTSSVMASTSLNHPTRNRVKKPKKERNGLAAPNEIDVLQEDPVVSNTPFLSKDTTSRSTFPKILVDEHAQLHMSVDNPIYSPPESPKSPNRHGRIPSTGQRATVMDVAQALLEHEQELEGEPEIKGEEEISPPNVKAMVAGWSQNLGPAPMPERRKSGFERYSVATATTLPPLVEVQTPVETPQATLSRVANQEQARIPSARAVQDQLQKSFFRREEEHDSNRTTEEIFVQGGNDENAELNSSPEQNSQQLKNDQDQLIELVFQTRLPPPFNPQQVIREIPFTPDLGVQTISIEISVISNGTIIPITQEQNIFYDTEVIVIIHRFKQKLSELVSNKAWIWLGKNSNWERERFKAIELAERFDKKTVNCLQGSEPVMLIHVLGGVLATRQGTRSHWSVENTTMHRIHRVGDSMFVDEVDLGIWNLCSAYSYCLSILGKLYVWNGRGSSEDERQVAQTYAATLSQTSLQIVEFEEGSEDEIFWMILGQADYASAHHWKFRDVLDRLGARIYAVDSSKARTPVQAILSVSAQELQDGVFVIDCRLEIYILITAEARGKHTDIQLALFLAENISSLTAHKRPFPPPVHVVIMPSKLPLELRAALRFCDEASMNGGNVPEHMNIVSFLDAVDQIHRRAWPRYKLADPSFLPIGVDPENLLFPLHLIRRLFQENFKVV